MSANLDPEIAARVRTGIALLDAKAPLGWRRKINPDTLDVALPYYCVLAHIYGHYDYGMVTLGIHPNSAIEYGFNTGGDPTSDSTWDDLTATWLQELGFTKLGA